MTEPRRWSRCFATIAIVTALAMGSEESLKSAASESAYCPAYFQASQGLSNEPMLTLFPWVGPESSIPLPTALKTNFRIISFGPDGRSLFGQKARFNGLSVPITKIDFTPLRESEVPGSDQVGTIWYLTISSSSEALLLSGWSTRGGECGAFELDSKDGTLRRLRVGAYPECGGAAGPVSPDGRYALISKKNGLTKIQLDTGAIRLLGSDLKGGVWSPNGRWIAAKSAAGKIALIDELEQPRRKDLGKASEGPIVWSPDSKYLLISKSELSCALNLYGGTLEIVNVQTGKRTSLKSSHCRILDGAFGWVEGD